MEQENNGAVMPELFKKLLLRELTRSGFSGAEYLPETGQIKVPIDGLERQPLITAKGSILYEKEHRDVAADVLQPMAERVKEIVAAWDNGRDMDALNLPEFRMLTEYNNIVFAARDDTEYGYGLHFATWEYNYDHTGMWQGHYTEDYDYAKEDFAIRAGLSQNKMFSQEQLAEIKTSVEYRTDNDWRVTYAQQDILNSIKEKLEDACPAPPISEMAPPGKKPSIGEKLREGKEKSDANRSQNPAPSSHKRAKEMD